MKKFLGVVCLVAVVFACQSTVLAGGGSKGDPTISVKNDGRDVLAFVVDPSADLQTKFMAGTATQADLTAEGGVLVNSGKTSAAKKVRIGNHTVAVVYVWDGMLYWPDPTIRTYAVVKNQALKLVAVQNTDDTATLTP